MKRPLRVKIVGKTHVIQYVPAENAALKNAEGADLLGCIDHDNQRISILDGQMLEPEQDVGCTKSCTGSSARWIWRWTSR